MTTSNTNESSKLKKKGRKCHLGFILNLTIVLMASKILYCFIVYKKICYLKLSEITHASVFLHLLDFPESSDYTKIKMAIFPKRL